jgi:hypothetical protein
MIRRYSDVAAAMILSSIMPIRATLILVAVCIILDTAFGLYKAHQKKQAITSKLFSAVVSKMFLYEFVIIFLFFIDSYLLNDIMKMFCPVDLFLTKLAGVVLVGVETLSIHENIKEATGFDFIYLSKNILRRGKIIKKSIEDI